MADEVLTEWSLAAETKEWVGPISVTADGVPEVAFETTLTAPGVRPATWVSPVELDFGGGLGFLVGVGTAFPLEPFLRYTVWIRLTDSPEIPVCRVGIVRTY